MTPPPPQLIPSSHLLPFHISPLPPLVTIWDRIGRECMGVREGAEPESIRNTRCVLHRKCGLFPIRSSYSILQSLKSSYSTLLLEPSIIFACKLQPIRKPPCSTLRVDEDDGACGECGGSATSLACCYCRMVRMEILSPLPLPILLKIVSCVAHAHTGEGGILWHLLNAMVVTRVVAQEAKVVSLSGLLGVASS